MCTNLLSEIDTDVFREHLLKYTKQAYQMLPQIKKPRILDLGCGSGVPTIELAKLSKGKIIAIDTNQILLNKFNKKIQKEELTKQVTTKNQSFFDLDLAAESFDIIWAEGTINIIGFEKALYTLRKLIKPNGFLVIHDCTNFISNKLEKIPYYCYKLLNFFELPKNAWWKEYGQPLEKKIKQLKSSQNTLDAKGTIRKYQAEVDWFKKNPDLNSAFYILQKI